MGEGKRMPKWLDGCLAVVVIGMGMLGLHFDVSYSGWVLSVGILWAFTV